MFQQEVQVVDGSGSEPDTDLFADGGEAGRLMAAYDWSSTTLGPVASWPTSLRHAVRTVLVSRFPMVVTWGPEFRQFYNDACAPLIGAKHPAIGEDIRVTLAESWDTLGPPIEQAMRTRVASYLPGLLVLLERAGYREETYFTVSHAPAFDDDGRVAGMHAVGTEVTGEILAARRQRVLHALSTVGARLGAEDDTVTSMCRLLEDDALDVPIAAVYLSSPEQPGFRRVTAVGCDARLLPATVVDPAELQDVTATLGVTGGPFGDPVTDAVVLPLRTAADAEPTGLLLAGCSPNRALDAEYRSFHELVAGQFAAAVANNRAFEAERRRAESLAELDRAKTAFFSDVSHELRTPLTLLLGPLDDVLDDPVEVVPDGVREQLTLAVRNGRRLQRLVNDLLDYAGIEAGRATPVRVDTDVAAFTAELAGIFRAATERAGLTLDVDCPPLGRPAHVDPRMWEKVVVNLLANAVKYTFVGGIRVALRADEQGFELAVCDTGVGIVAEELPQLFHRFHRVPGAAARTREGTGIGLALVHELTALHGGEVFVDSEPGVGSTFTVRMPFGEPDAVDQAPRTPSEVARGEAESWEEDTSRPRGDGAGPAEVLVVDDNADMRAYLTRLLAPLWAVRTTANGEEALEAVAESAPDVVLTDVMMPRVDGFELLRRLRLDPATRDIPVIMLTARAGQEASVEGLEAGADDYLAKPFRAQELIARVRVAVERAAGRRAVSSAEEPSAPAPEPPPVAARLPAPRLPTQRLESRSGRNRHARWRVPSDAASIPSLRRALRTHLDQAGIEGDQAYDLLLAACEAATNAVEHAQDPVEPFVDVEASVAGGSVRISVRDYGQWRERVPSMDRGRGSTLMTAVGTITATPSAEGTTVVIEAPLDGSAT